MTGADALRAMRRSVGQVPIAVWITDGDEPRAQDWHEERNCIDGHYHAAIGLTTNDIPETLDLRCVVGLEVHLSAERGEPRARRLHDVLVEAGAKRVITSIHAETGIDLLTHGV